jgi:branched-subunit amino acid ABC-type transport system permease component
MVRRTEITMLMLAVTPQPPLTNLYLSLAFGAGQVIIGTAMALFVTRKRRWQKITHALLAFIGIWFAFSGITELIVSGAEVLARTGHTLTTAGASHLRAQADQAFLIASLVLLTIGAAYLLLVRLWLSRRPSKSTQATPEEAIGITEVSNKPEGAQTAEAER